MKCLLPLVLLVAFSASAEEKHATGLVFPENWQALTVWDNTEAFTADLPAKFNWNDIRQLQPIRNQKSCGSCWAFSVTAVAESLVRILRPTQLPFDYAEQTLVSSCCSAGSCGGGFFTAFNCVQIGGLPWETDDPYQARNSRCKEGLDRHLKITRWAYVGSGRTGATTEQIKQAIYQHGPVSVDVNGSFSYSGGVYTKCGSTGTNHMVTLEGWVDDAAYSQYGGGYWIMRNSWGENWGEKGYMRIVYKSKSGSKCNGIGQVTAYAVLDGIENLPQQLGF